ncbi:restriction endonuclease [uncultured Friedmanniella sp.]|uniref:restriction endonuclease n=1 Tax=uncultured Friedmanniella sp. TaxID=335381 RepID=UPI0035CC9D28
MLDDVIDAYLETVTEREFDLVLLSLLHRRGFTEVHFTHGGFEFGKDFVAQRVFEGVRYQYCIQSKAGDMGQGEWRAVYPQLDEARLNTLSHPSFDESLRRVGVLLTTGRLKGGATLAAQNYAQQAIQRGEPTLEVWDRDEMRRWLLDDPDAGLRGTDQAGRILRLVAAIEDGKMDQMQLQQECRSLFTGDIQVASICTAVLANSCRRSSRPDLASVLALSLLREALSQSNEGAARLARRLFIAEVAPLLEWLESRTHDSVQLARDLGGVPYVTYPTACLKAAELCALYLLLQEPEAASSAGIGAKVLTNLLTLQPGTAHLLSDVWASSLLPIVVAMSRIDKTVTTEYLHRVVDWIADAYDEGFGLASGADGPRAEIDQLFGAPFEHVALEKRRASYAAAVVMDLATALRLSELYEYANNEFLAVGADATVVIGESDAGWWGMKESEARMAPRVVYREAWSPTEPAGPHHQAAPPTASAWDALAIFTLVRDRHCYQTLAVLLEDH